MNDETITILKSRYNELIETEILMDALDAGGVDNWVWYDEARKEANGLIADRRQSQAQQEAKNA